jgi:SAM-dependent methyltransferase
MSGMSVLDIGCNAGHFAFQAKDRGAVDVVGVDLKQGYVDQARFCAEVRGQDVDFRVMSIYDLAQLERKFDFVFCIGILYHCKFLMHAVEAACSVTAGTIVVETAIHPGNTDLPLVRFVRSSQYGGPDSQGAARLPGHWHPNMTALRDMFAEYGFSSVEDVFVDGGRGGIVARR